MSTALKGELSKLAKLSCIESGLPPILRAAPAIAIAAGAAIATATAGRNVVEERLLGSDNAIALANPSSRAVPAVSRGMHGSGVGMQVMYTTCLAPGTRVARCTHSLENLSLVGKMDAVRLSGSGAVIPSVLDKRAHLPLWRSRAVP
ncbi:hypothetical protein HIM_04425 [Hirsutella minnesotensis 3608]|uniref:Uncharacterized protein n=1 Tax=Hirsutella minnesotensis 3608 TaxID=1043627 RepID=A0A0F7ZVB9_9HYPO|nr:hypothetical protein HIM_04425 [Hirsutella minnesotensis 3608]